MSPVARARRCQACRRAYLLTPPSAIAPSRPCQTNPMCASPSPSRRATYTTIGDNRVSLPASLTCVAHLRHSPAWHTCVTHLCRSGAKTVYLRDMEPARVGGRVRQGVHAGTQHARGAGVAGRGRGYGARGIGAAAGTTEQMKRLYCHVESTAKASNPSSGCRQREDARGGALAN